MAWPLEGGLAALWQQFKETFRDFLGGPTSSLHGF
jgi:hypothetical protein